MRWYNEGRWETDVPSVDRRGTVRHYASRPQQQSDIPSGVGQEEGEHDGCTCTGAAIDWPVSPATILAWLRHKRHAPMITARNVAPSLMRRAL